jgi:hypothetical protein
MKLKVYIKCICLPFVGDKQRTDNRNRAKSTAKSTAKGTTQGAANTPGDIPNSQHEALELPVPSETLLLDIDSLIELPVPSDPLLLDADSLNGGTLPDIFQTLSNLDSIPYQGRSQSDAPTTRSFPFANEEQLFQDIFSGFNGSGELNQKTLPSPYINHIRINRQCLYAACHRNVLQIGVPIHLAETPGYPSPFYQPHPSSVNQTATSVFRPDLQPSIIQRTIPHEIYIDVIPFPTWRDRVINLLSLSPPGFDEMELKRDLDKDGLICWGSLNGRGSGAPWDRRSWEAQQWFLDKWWFIIKDTEVDNQSAWWRMMRGEDEEDM